VDEAVATLLEIADAELDRGGDLRVSAGHRAVERPDAQLLESLVFVEARGQLGRPAGRSVPGAEHPAERAGHGRLDLQVELGVHQPGLPRQPPGVGRAHHEREALRVHVEQLRGLVRGQPVQHLDGGGLGDGALGLGQPLVLHEQPGQRSLHHDPLSTHLDQHRLAGHAAGQRRDGLLGPVRGCRDEAAEAQILHDRADGRGLGRGAHALK